MVDDLFSKICFELGSTACEQGDLSLTYKLYGEAFSIQDQAGRVALAATLRKLARLYFERERLQEAEQLYEKAVSIYKDLPVPDYDGLKDALDDLADYYRT